MQFVTDNRYAGGHHILLKKNVAADRSPFAIAMIALCAVSCFFDFAPLFDTLSDISTTYSPFPFRAFFKADNAHIGR
jgi:hypothetical protein